MLEYRFRLFACYFVMGFFSIRVRHLYLDSCGPIRRYEADLFGPCSESFSGVYAVAVVLGLTMILKLVAPELMGHLFERRPPS